MVLSSLAIPSRTGHNVLPKSMVESRHSGVDRHGADLRVCGVAELQCRVLDVANEESGMYGRRGRECRCVGYGQCELGLCIWSAAGQRDLEGQKGREQAVCDGDGDAKEVGPRC